MLMNLTLRQIRVFERVARRSSFTRAAEELFLTQPAVSMQIKQFEETVGLPLFERLGRKIYLTTAGEEMYRVCRTIIQHLDEAQQLMEEIKGTEGGTLKISVASTVHYFAIRLLGEFRNRYPKVHINLQVTNRKNLLMHLEQNDADIVLMGQPPDDHDLQSEAFMENPLVVIASPTHHLRDVHPVSLASLKNETFLMREPGSGTRSSVERYFADKGMSISSSMEMNTNEAIKQGVEIGLGLGVVSLHTVEQDLESGRLAMLDVESFPLMRQWYMVHRSGKRFSRVALAFKEFVRAEAGRFVKGLPAWQNSEY